MATHSTTSPPSTGARFSPRPEFVTPTVFTPKVTRSKGITIAVIVFLLMVVLTAISINWENHKAKLEKQKDNWPKFGGLTQITPTDQKQDLSRIAYGQISTFEVKPGHSVPVELTNDWCPIWSSGPIDAYNSNENEKRVLDGNRFIQGPSTSVGNNSWIFENKGTNSIIIKTGRCVSKDNCTIHF